MSTKINKALKSLNLKKRRTVQVRMEVGLHRKMSAEARRWKLTLSKLIDKVGNYYIKNYTDEARYNENKI